MTNESSLYRHYFVSLNNLRSDDDDDDDDDNGNGNDDVFCEKISIMLIAHLNLSVHSSPLLSSCDGSSLGTNWMITPVFGLDSCKQAHTHARKKARDGSLRRAYLSDQLIGSSVFSIPFQASWSSVKLALLRCLNAM